MNTSTWDEARQANPVALSFVLIELDCCSCRYRLGKYTVDGRRMTWLNDRTYALLDDAMHAADLYNGPEANAVFYPGD
jgi:hypothetical protein